MATVLDLKKKKEPIVQTADAINVEVEPTLASAPAMPVLAELPVAIPYPTLNDREILTDSGERMPFRTIRWTGPLAYRTEGTGIPYILAIVLVGVGILIGIYQGNLIAAVLFVGMGIMTAVHAYHPHPDVPIEISPVSIKLGNRKYSHSEIHSFWIHHDLPHGMAELSLHVKRWHLPYFKIPLYEVDPSQIRMLLLEFIPEVEHDDPASHRLMKHLGI